MALRYNDNVSAVVADLQQLLHAHLVVAKGSLAARREQALAPGWPLLFIKASFSKPFFIARFFFRREKAIQAEYGKEVAGSDPFEDFSGEKPNREKAFLALESFKFIALNDAAYSRVLSRVARLGRSF
jgi:hypothetical protein